VRITYSREGISGRDRKFADKVLDVRKPELSIEPVLHRRRDSANVTF
jgi:hypothetical protein